MYTMRLIGGLLLALAILAMGAEGFHALEQGTPAWPAAGELWFAVAPGSIAWMRGLVVGHLWPPLWDPVLASLLQWPASLLLLVPAVLLRLVGRRRARRRIFAPPPRDPA